jgi:glutamate-1-semialdehyde aminotransferase
MRPQVIDREHLRQLRTAEEQLFIERHPRSAELAGEPARRFKLPQWQMAMTTTDANRFVLRFARQLTGRSKNCVMDWCSSRHRGRDAGGSRRTR